MISPRSGDFILPEDLVLDYSQRIRADASINQHFEPFVYLHLPPMRSESGALDMVCDREGRLYVATTIGVQVCDPVGRVHCILPAPNGDPIYRVMISGDDLQTLYIETRSDKNYSRKIGHKGIKPGEGPIAQTKPKL